MRNMGCPLPTPAPVTPPAGICHTDYHQVNDEWGGGIFPMVPGHEIVGIVTEVGPKVKSLKPGDRVGVGCFVESCMKCDRYSSSQLVALTSAGRRCSLHSVVRGLQRAQSSSCSKPSQLYVTLERLSLQWLLVLLFCVVYCAQDGTVWPCSQPSQLQISLERLSLQWLLVPSGLVTAWPQSKATILILPVLQVQEAGGELLPQVRAYLQRKGLPWGGDIWRLQHTPGGA